MKFILIIPARFKSTRFPGKPLAKIAGKSMIIRVYEQCCKGFNGEVIVATEDKLIQKFCQSNNIKSEITSDSCLTGTDRVAEIATKYNADYYINVQGDEPLFNPNDIKEFIIKINSDKRQYSVFAGYTLIKDSEEYFSSQIPKMLINEKRELIYSSRAPIPANKKNEFVMSYKQVCIYGYNRKALDLFSSFNKKTPIEDIEDLELLRFIELGTTIKMIELSDTSISVDNPEDINKVELILKKS